MRELHDECFAVASYGTYSWLQTRVPNILERMRSLQLSSIPELVLPSPLRLDEKYPSQRPSSPTPSQRMVQFPTRASPCSGANVTVKGDRMLSRSVSPPPEEEHPPPLWLCETDTFPVTEALDALPECLVRFWTSRFDDVTSLQVVATMEHEVTATYHDLVIGTAVDPRVAALFEAAAWVDASLRVPNGAVRWLRYLLQHPMVAQEWCAQFQDF